MRHVFTRCRISRRTISHRTIHTDSAPLFAFNVKGQSLPPTTARTGFFAQQKAPGPPARKSFVPTEPAEEVEPRDNEYGATEGSYVNDAEDYTEDSRISHYGADHRFAESDPRSQRSKTISPMLPIYRPNREAIKGSAAQFAFAAYRKAVFLSMAKQQGEKTAPRSTEKQFAWENKIVFKLDVTDMAKVLNALEGKTQAVDILHLSDNTGQQRYTTLKMKQTVQGNGNYLSLIKAEGENKQQVSILIDETDGRALRLFLEESIRRSLGFGPQ